MGRWMLGVVLLAVLLFVPRAWATGEGRPFEELPLTHWAYREVRTLEGQGYFTGSPPGTFNGRTVRTRYEFAVAVERMYRTFQPRVLSATDAGRLPEDLKSFRRLVDEFGANIAELGPDLDEIRRQLENSGPIEQRIERLPKPRPEPEPEAVQPPPAKAAPPVTLSAPRAFGLKERLQETFSLDMYDRLGTARPGAAAVRPGFAASLGPALVGIDLQPPDPLHTVPGLPLDESTRDFRARVSVPFGSSVASAYYDRTADFWDWYGIRGEGLSTGPVESVGARLSGSINSRVGFSVQGGSLSSLQGDTARASFVRGGVNYRVAGFTLGAGYQRARQIGLGSSGVVSNYFMSLEKGLGRNTWFNFLLRYPTRGSNTTGPADSSAVTSISVRF